MKLERVLKLNSIGEDVHYIQIILKKHGFYHGDINNIYSKDLFESVGNFQRKMGLKPSGEIDKQTWNRIKNYDKNGKQEKKDDKIKYLYVSTDGFNIINNFLPEEYYYKEKKPKSFIIIKNPLYTHDPIKSIYLKNTEYKINEKNIPILDDNKLVEIKNTPHFIIGGYTKSDKTYNGKVYQLFDDNYWTHHTNVTNTINNKFNSSSISIEICNLGPVRKIDDEFYNLTGHLIDPKYVTEFEDNFLGYKYWHKFSQEQIKSLKKLIQFLSKKWDIDVSEKYDNKWFQWDKKWREMKGLKNECQIFPDRFGLPPQEEILNMLKSL